MASDITGSWFPGGFHGYTKLTRARNDVSMVYRHLAKPLPPAKFMWRSEQPPTKHCFSHHDNRRIFLCDAQYLTQGLGKKKLTGPKTHSPENLVAWMPDEEYLKRTGTFRSTYQRTFRQASPKGKFTPKFLQRNITTTPFYDTNTSVTTYQLEHNGASSYSQILKPHMFNTCMKMSQCLQIARPLTAPPTFKESVASCLQWSVPSPPPAWSQQKETCNNLSLPLNISSH